MCKKFAHEFPLLYHSGMDRTLVGIREAAEFLGVLPIDVTSMGNTKKRCCPMSAYRVVIGVTPWRGYDPNHFIDKTNLAKPSPQPAYRATIRKTIWSGKSNCRSSMVRVRR